ncbi:MAG: helix-turn-helix domain-containing protein [Chitinivibrionales bacterium]|nr:helix-turn-helix domain-containing protein [Chitinivibrionales bacterium]
MTSRLFVALLMDWADWLIAQPCELRMSVVVTYSRALLPRASAWPSPGSRQHVPVGRAHDAYRMHTVRGLCLAVIAELHRLAAPDGAPDAAGDAAQELDGVNRIRPALEWIHRHFTDALSTLLLAEKVYMSPTHFRRVFGKAMGVSPHAYLTGYRVSLACGELRRGRSVQSVALDVGFGSVSAFTRAFRSHIGESPKRWALRRHDGIPGRARPASSYSPIRANEVGPGKSR